MINNAIPPRKFIVFSEILILLIKWDLKCYFLYASKKFRKKGVDFSNFLVQRYAKFLT